MAYVGLAPSESSSGPAERRGGITKTGNSHARRILIEAAWHYRYPPAARNRLLHSMKGEPLARILFARKAQARLHRCYVRLLAGASPGAAVATATASQIVTASNSKGSTMACLSVTVNSPVTGFSQPRGAWR